jgi:hypothetical protein
MAYDCSGNMPEVRFGKVDQLTFKELKNMEPGAILAAIYYLNWYLLILLLF